MNLPDNERLEQLKSYSRQAALGTAIGGAIVLAAIAYSVVKLSSLQVNVGQLEAKKTELEGTITTQNTTISTQQSAIEDNTLAVAKKQKELQRLQGEIKQVRTWGNLFRLCALGGRIAVAKNHQEAAAIYREMQTVERELPQKTEYLSQATDRIGRTLETWSKNPGQPPPEQLKGEVLALGRQAREEFQGAPEVLKSFERELERVLYDQAIATAGRLNRVTDPHEVNLAREEFYKLYYGDLVFLESPDFAGAMVKLNTAIKTSISESALKKDVFSEELKDLKTARRASLADP